jgi:hypothetical protein
MSLIYEDFHLRLAPDGNDGFQVQASFHEQRASGPLMLHPELWLVGSLPGEACAGPSRHLGLTADSNIGEGTSPEEVGSRLFQALLGGEVGRLFNTVQGACDEDPNRALRLRLHFPPREKRAWRLQSLPWELLYHAEDRRFFALSRRMPVIRSLDTPRPLRVLPDASPLRVLVAMANPPDTVPLDLPAERRKIEEAFSRIAGIEIVVLEQATPRDLRLRLRDKPFFHIVHFMGHGVGFDEGSGEGALLLDSPGGEAVPLSATGLTEIFEDLAVPRLVVLNACETALTSEGVDPVRSVAASLIVAGLPAVLAQRTAIQDEAALILAEELYRRLAQEDPIEAAVAEARKALRLERWGTTAWAIPSLFVRPAPGDVLSHPVEATVTETAPPPPSREVVAGSPGFEQNVRAGRVGKQTNIQGGTVHYHEESGGK